MTNTRDDTTWPTGGHPAVYDRLKEKLAVDRVPLLASAITFNVLVTAIPFLLLVLSLLGLVVQSSSEVRVEVLEIIRRGLPVSAGVGREWLDGLADDHEWIGTIGVLGLIWATTRLFGSLRDVLEIVFEIPRDTKRGFVRGKFEDARMVVVVGSLFLISVGLTSLARAAHTRLAAVIGLDLFREGWLVQGLGVVGGLVVTFGMFFVLFRRVSGRRIESLDAILAAVFAAVLFECAKIVFVLATGRFTGSLELYGSLAGVVATMLWVYYSSVVFIVGAEIASARRWTRIARPGARTVVAENRAAR